MGVTCRSTILHKDSLLPGKESWCSTQGFLAGILVFNTRIPGRNPGVQHQDSWCGGTCRSSILHKDSLLPGKESWCSTQGFLTEILVFNTRIPGRNPGVQ